MCNGFLEHIISLNLEQKEPTCCYSLKHKGQPESWPEGIDRMTSCNICSHLNLLPKSQLQLALKQLDTQPCTTGGIQIVLSIKSLLLMAASFLLATKHPKPAQDLHL